MRKPKFRNRNAVIFVLLCIFNVMPVRVYGSCDSCVTLKKDLEQKQKTKVLLADAKKKNEEYLSNHSDATASILIKVKSNLIVIQLRSETVENEMTLITSNLKKGCDQCQ